MLLLPVKTSKLKHTKSVVSSFICCLLSVRMVVISDDNLLDIDPGEADCHEFYDWDMIPKRNSEEAKTGVSIKGDTDEYIAAHGKILKMMSQKGAKFFLNGREFRILDNAKNKPLKVEVKPLKGATGKVNLKIYTVNTKGSATMMISKVSDGDILHVKTLAFGIINNGWND